jgi:hypothetical protein
MTTRLLRNLIVGLVVGIAGFSFQRVLAEEPPQPEQLGPPREVVPEILIPEDGPWYRPIGRTSRWDVWQYYGVDRSGHFRPLVIYSGADSFYLYNGEPYPWVNTHQLEFMPYVVD